MTGKRTDVKSPAILLPFAVCYESPWSPSIPAPIFMGSIDVWPEVCADGWIHVRIARRLGLRLPLALAFLASLVTLLPFPHIPPPSPLSFPPSWIFTVNVVSHFSSCSPGSSNTEGLQKHLCLGDLTHLTCVWGSCQPSAARVLGRERAISWTAVGRGEWLSWSFHLAPLERTL